MNLAFAPWTVVISLIVLGGCGNRPDLRDSLPTNEVASIHMQPFIPPSSEATVGSVLRYRIDGSEEILYHAAECGNPLPTEEVVIGLPNVFYNSESKGALKIVSDALFKNLTNIDALFSVSNISTVELSFINPMKKITRRPQAQSIVATWADECKQALAGDAFFVQELLIADGVRYTIRDRSGAEMNFSAEIVGIAKLTPETDRIRDQGGKLEINDRLNYGYRLYEGRIVQGVVDEAVMLTDIDPHHAEEVRRSHGLSAPLINVLETRP